MENIVQLTAHPYHAVRFLPSTQRTPSDRLIYSDASVLILNSGVRLTYAGSAPKETCQTGGIELLFIKN